MSEPYTSYVVSRLRAWIIAVRPATLPISAAPVLLGTALALYDKKFAPVPALVALCCALLLQVVSNLVNDVYDFRRGADTRERLGPPRAVASGILAQSQVERAAWYVAGTAFIMGQYLVWIGGWQILALGILALVIAWAYTGSPVALAYRGLGEVCAFVFFGIVPVCGTYYVQTHTWSFTVLCASIAPGLWAASVLLVNNIRDISTDTAAGKGTLAVRIGDKRARYLYCMLVGGALGISGVCALMYYSWIVLLSAGMIVPWGVAICRALMRAHGRDLNRVLVCTVGLGVMHSVLLSVAIVGQGLANRL
ncbi:MAG: 1,4-dihydroxy-2-naphthoate polyprenyltransferase [Bacteroidota bacterium]|nr:1,4-dihydroxy-2-naphthoate polyprenyltransferase [Candidatus Kapabacteria bacterium]MDW8220287.1 1,4-dihydroxy-2-naphthoate polyprenyltransferase [Bacteroidota bacterium]